MIVDLLPLLWIGRVRSILHERSNRFKLMRTLNLPQHVLGREFISRRRFHPFAQMINGGLAVLTQIAVLDNARNHLLRPEVWVGEPWNLGRIGPWGRVVRIGG